MVSRFPSIPARIADLKNGIYIESSQEEKKPSYVVTKLGDKVVRASICGTIIDKYINPASTYGFLVVMDETGEIRCKFFLENVSKIDEFEIGDVVHVIGKIKEFNSEISINTEIIKKVDEKFEIYHRLKIIKNVIKKDKIIQEILKEINTSNFDEMKEMIMSKYEIDEEQLRAIMKNKAEIVDYKSMILKLIKELDEGEGVLVGKIFENLKLDEREIENVIDQLLEEGRLYEPKPGVLKVVE